MLLSGAYVCCLGQWVCLPRVVGFACKYVWEGKGYWDLSMFGNEVWGYWVSKLLLYSWVSGGLGMWGKDGECLSRGFLLVY
jgi:hypothetical protein